MKINHTSEEKVVKLAERLRVERKVAGFSTDALAKKLNVSMRTLQYWEHGDREPSIDMLIVISRVLNISIDYLTGNID